MRRRQSRPVSYNALRRRVMEHRATDVLVAIARVNAQFHESEFERAEPPRLPNFVQPFALAGVARTALVGGQDRYGRAVLPSDLIEMCSLYANVYDPILSEAPGTARLRAFMNRTAYEQFGSQFSPMENVGRTVVLFGDHADVHPDAPTPVDWAQGLGVSLEHFIRIGFGVQAAAAVNGGVIDRRVLGLPHFAPMFTPATADDALAIVDRWFAAPPSELKASGIAEEARGSEKWSLNPLVARPIVTLDDGRYVVPWPRLVVDRLTPTALYFIGLELFGARFPGALGNVFEGYIGAHLRLLVHAEIRPEIEFGTPVRKTVDYFVITPEVVVLVEVKAARPVRATRLGDPEGDADTAKKLGYAYRQIDRTAELIRDGHPAVAAIPSDRPLVGLVVTLEPFHLVNTDICHDEVLTRPSIPTAIAPAHELEATVAVLAEVPETGRRLLEALSSDGPGGARLDDACEGLPRAPNALLDDAWERFTRPWTDLSASHEPR